MYVEGRRPGSASLSRPSTAGSQGPSPSVVQRNHDELLSVAEEIKRGSIQVRYASQKTKAATTQAQAGLQDKVNLALKHRIELMHTSKVAAEKKLIAILAEQDRLNHSKMLLEDTLKSKEKPYRLAKRSLSKRLHRPKVENARDDVERLLEDEVKELEAIVEKLLHELKKTKHDLKKLAVVRERLELQVHNKTAAMLTDTEVLEFRLEGGAKHQPSAGR